MKLYMVNPTNQDQRVCYRLDVDKDGVRMSSNTTRFRPHRFVDIPAGRQVQFAGDMHISQIVDIVDQLRPFGLYGEIDVRDGKLVENVQYGTLGQTVSLIFNIDQSVPHLIISHAMEFNAGVRATAGQKLRELCAVASGGKLGTEKVDLSIEQEILSDPEESPIDEGFRVKFDRPNRKPVARVGA